MYSETYRQFYHGMTRYDYKYQRQKQTRVLRPQRMNRVSRAALLNIFMGLLVGAGAGLYYAWQVSPVKYLDNDPYALRVDYANDYLLLIAQKYSIEKDIRVSRAYLSDLGLDRPGEVVAARVEYMIATGHSSADINAMAELAKALGADTAKMQPFLS